MINELKIPMSIKATRMYLRIGRDRRKYLVWGSHNYLPASIQSINFNRGVFSGNGIVHEVTGGHTVVFAAPMIERCAGMTDTITSVIKSGEEKSGVHI